MSGKWGEKKASEGHTCSLCPLVLNPGSAPDGNSSSRSAICHWLFSKLLGVDPGHNVKIYPSTDTVSPKNYIHFGPRSLRSSVSSVLLWRTEVTEDRSDRGPKWTYTSPKIRDHMSLIFCVPEIVGNRICGSAIYRIYVYQILATDSPEIWL